MPAGRLGPLGGAPSRPPVADAAAEVQDLLNRLGALSGAAGVYLVQHLQGPLPVPIMMGLGLVIGATWSLWHRDG